jgi:hypothetical protein
MNGMAWWTTFTVALAGCFGGINTHMTVRVTNWTDLTHDVRAEAVFRGDVNETWMEWQGLVRPQESVALPEFERPCERRLTGTLTIRIALANGTAATLPQEWTPDSCNAQHVEVRLYESGIGFDDVFA